MSELFGIWGGTPPGGWCHIWYKGRKEGSNFGTREEAERVLPEFLHDHPDCTYEVVPFDPLRQPAFTLGKPTKAQLEAMRRIQKYRTINLRPFIPRATLNVLSRNGWFMHSANGKDCELTLEGTKLLEKYDAGKRKEP